MVSRIIEKNYINHFHYKNINTDSKINYSFEIRGKKNMILGDDNTFLNKNDQENIKILYKLILIISMKLYK